MEQQYEQLAREQNAQGFDTSNVNQEMNGENPNVHKNVGPHANPRNNGRQGASYNPQPRGLERFILALYGIYGINIFIWSMRLRWHAWVPVVVMSMLFVSWMAHAFDYRNFKFRIKFNTYKKRKLQELSFFIVK